MQPSVSSATLRVDAYGALNTGIPRRAASAIATWSVPTEKHPMASIRPACSRCSSRTLVRDRTPSTCDAAITSHSSSPSSARGMTSTE